MKLPNADRAVVDIEKLRDYSLNPNHPKGKHKARVFLAALGFKANDAERLRELILEAILTTEAKAQQPPLWTKIYSGFSGQGGAGISSHACHGTLRMDNQER